MNNLESIIKGITTGFRAPRQYKVNKESTQNPALEYDKLSPGTQVAFAQPIPTTIDSALGASDPYEMNPVNGRHWTNYVADSSQRIFIPHPKPSPANVLAALSEPQDLSTIGSNDPWHNHYALMSLANRGYHNNTYRGY